MVLPPCLYATAVTRSVPYDSIAAHNLIRACLSVRPLVVTLTPTADICDCRRSMLGFSVRLGSHSRYAVPQDQQQRTASRALEFMCRGVPAYGSGADIFGH